MSTSDGKSPKQTIKTVGDYIDRLSQFPREWEVLVATSAGGGVAIEHRDVNGQSVVAIFGSNGGRFGENPLTDEEYAKRSKEFIDRIKQGLFRYTNIHGDHRLYIPSGRNDTCYGTRYDERIIDRMVNEGLLEYYQVPYGSAGVRLASRSQK